MSRKQLVTLLGAACASLVLAACIPSLPDDAELLSVRKSRYGMGGRETGAAIYVSAFLF